MAYCENCGTKIISDSNFCSECGTKIKNNVVITSELEDISKEDSELDENFVKETLHSMKEFVERSSEIKDEDDIKIKDIKSFFELGERIEKLGSIAQESKTIESNNKTKISYDTLEIIESIVGVLLIIGLVIVLVIYFPDYKDNLPEWLKSIFDL